MILKFACSCHVDQFTFHISLPSQNSSSLFTFHRLFIFYFNLLVKTDSKINLSRWKFGALERFSGWNIITLFFYYRSNELSPLGTLCFLCYDLTRSWWLLENVTDKYSFSFLPRHSRLRPWYYFIYTLYRHTLFQLANGHLIKIMMISQTSHLNSWLYYVTNPQIKIKSTMLLRYDLTYWQAAWIEVIIWFQTILLTTTTATITITINIAKIVFIGKR